MYLKFQNYDKNGKEVRGKQKFLNVFLASIYHPWEDEAHYQFSDILEDILKKVRDQNEVIFGADTNARIGTRDIDE